MEGGREQWERVDGEEEKKRRGEVKQTRRKGWENAYSMKVKRGFGRLQSSSACVDTHILFSILYFTR